MAPPRKALPSKRPVAQKTPAVNRIQKASGSKRGQPTTAARVAASDYIKFGWHTALSQDSQDLAGRLGVLSDAMYMLEIERDRQIEPQSLRNGIFWEHQQLADEFMVSTPAVDHIDLFPEDDEVFQDTIRRIGKIFSEPNKGLQLHYIFMTMRPREFLVLPVQLKKVWVTIIARIEPQEQSPSQDLSTYADRRVTDLAIVDALPDDRQDRRDLVRDRLHYIFEQGAIEMSDATTEWDLALPDIQNEDCEANGPWKTGLVAYAVSREFLRRLKALEWRRQANPDEDLDRSFLFAPWEEHYNFDAYRQSLMAACANQCIEKSDYRVRMVLEIPSENAEYRPDRMINPKTADKRLSDERWDAFHEPTHTSINGTGSSSNDSEHSNDSSSSEENEASGGHQSSNKEGESSGNGQSSKHAPETSGRGARPVAEMGQSHGQGLPEFAGLTGAAPAGQQSNVGPEQTGTRFVPTNKRNRADDAENGEKAPSKKRIKIVKTTKQE